MKTPLLIMLFLLTNLSKGFCQDIASAKDLMPFFFDLPLDTDKQTIIKAAKEKFSGGKINGDSIIANTRIYFENSTVTYEYFSNRPLITKLKLYDIWNYGQLPSDTAFHVVIEAYYGNDKRAKRRMHVEYENLIERFKGSFPKEMPYTMQAEGIVAEGYNYYFSDTQKPILTAGWDNGGCFKKYYTRVLFKKLIN